MTCALFTPYRLGPTELANRIVVSPMCQYSAQDGAATGWHHIHLGQFALSGAGLVFVEATAVEPAGRITPGCLGLYSDATEAALAGVVRGFRAEAGATRIGIQLAHAGRKAASRRPWEGGGGLPLGEGGWPTVAPSAVAFDDGRDAPQALDTAGLARIRDAFVASARRAVRIGFDAIELHMAHGYLLHQFLSPLGNRRDDAYGGALENRLRFPLEVFDAVRKVVPETIALGVRVSATDWIEGGWTPDETVALAKALERRGCRFMDVSTGGISTKAKIALAPGYQVPFAARVRAATALPVMAVGLIAEPQHAESIVASGQADLISLGRVMLDDPRWPWRAAAALGAEASLPDQYGYAVGARWRELARQPAAAAE